MNHLAIKSVVLFMALAIFIQWGLTNAYPGT